MKKQLLLSLALILSLVFNTGLAEVDAFSFRNNVTWGMNESDVVNSEGLSEYEEGEISIGRVISFDDISAAGSSAELKYYFINDKLVDISYTFYDDQVDYESLAASYSAKYGEPSDLDAQRVIDDMRWMAEDIDGSEALELDDIIGADEGLAWEIGDTYIIIYRAYLCNVMYINEALTREEIETYKQGNQTTINTDGI